MLIDDVVNRSRGTAERTSMLKRGMVRVEVAEGRINGQDRYVINRARQWLEAELKLPFLLVEYFTLQERVWDERNEYASWQAELGELLDCLYGYVLRASPSVANLRTDQSRDDLVKALVHEARHSWQMTTSLGRLVAEGRMEWDAQEYVKTALPRLWEALRDPRWRVSV